MTRTLTANRIDRLQALNLADAAWPAQQAQVDADIEGLSSDAEADRLAAGVNASPG